MKMIVSGIINGTVAVSIGVIGVYGYDKATTEQALAAFDSKERYCLTQNIFFEARNQSVEGREAVAWVTLNRMDHKKYPNTICGVVWDKKQFSWTHDGKSDKPSDNVVEQRAWKDAEKIADKVLVDYVKKNRDITNGSIMYHADYVNPYWAKAYDKVVTIDSHIFYK